MNQLQRMLCCTALSCVLFSSCASSLATRQASSGPTGSEVRVIERIGFASVSYVMTKDRQGRESRQNAWSAFVSYHTDGRIEGSHLAGNPPFVHQEKGTLAESARRELWQAAAAVTTLTWPPDPKIDPVWTSYEELTISGADPVKESLRIVWPKAPHGKQPPPEVKGLLELILKYRVGGW